MVDAKSTARLSKRFQKQIEGSRDTAEAAWKAMQNTGQLKQHQINKNEWDGDVFNYEGMRSPFDKTENEEDVRESIKDSKSPGVVGDLIVSVMQGDYLAVQERSFRSRHTTRVRATIHRSARAYGQQHNAGVLQQGVVGHAEGILKQSKS